MNKHMIFSVKISFFIRFTIEYVLIQSMEFTQENLVFTRWIITLSHTTQPISYLPRERIVGYFVDIDRVLPKLYDMETLTALLAPWKGT